jgi:hypothetical protein
MGILLRIKVSIYQCVRAYCSRPTQGLCILFSCRIHDFLSINVTRSNSGALLLTMPQFTIPAQPRPATIRLRSLQGVAPNGGQSEPPDHGPIGRTMLYGLAAASRPWLHACWSGVCVASRNCATLQCAASWPTIRRQDTGGGFLRLTLCTLRDSGDSCLPQPHRSHEPEKRYTEMCPVEK